VKRQAITMADFGDCFARIVDLVGGSTKVAGVKLRRRVPCVDARRVRDYCRCGLWDKYRVGLIADQRLACAVLLSLIRLCNSRPIRFLHEAANKLGAKLSIDAFLDDDDAAAINAIKDQYVLLWNYKVLVTKWLEYRAWQAGKDKPKWLEQLSRI
jgi:hypothetical protein